MSAGNMRQRGVDGQSKRANLRFGGHSRPRTLSGQLRQRAISGIAEHNIGIISPDIGGGFGNKVGVYPGYVCSIVASMVTGVPVKWVEDRSDNLMATAFARDYWMKGKNITATKDGKITALHCHTTADHGAFDACADPTKFPAGFMNMMHEAPMIFQQPTWRLTVFIQTKPQAVLHIAAHFGLQKPPIL